MKIVADKDIPLAENLFSKIGEVTLADGRGIDHELIHNADLLLVRTITRVSEELLRDSTVRVVVSATSGVDHVDREYLHRNGIEFIHASGANARPVAEYVLSALCVLAGQDGYELHDKRVGIIGCGNTGGYVLRFLEIMGVDCVINDPPLRDKTGDKRYHDLSELMSADIITLHVPLHDAGPYPTRNLVDSVFLQELRPDVVLINTSRGGVVDEKALMEFLNGTPRARAILDVWKDEPRIDTALLSRVAIGTSHIAGYSLEGKVRATQMVYHQVCKYLGTGTDDTVASPGISDFENGISFTSIEDEDEILRFAVLAGYDVRSDSAAMRRILDLDVAQQAAYFDDLRRSSMLRREFSAMTVSLPAGCGVLREKLTALGFEVADI